MIEFNKDGCCFSLHSNAILQRETSGLLSIIHSFCNRTITFRIAFSRNFRSEYVMKADKVVVKIGILPKFIEISIRPNNDISNKSTRGTF